MKNFIECYPANSEIALFFKIKSSLLNSEKDLLCTCVYIPPSSSLYAIPDCFEKLENDIIDTKDNNDCDILVFGDCNATTKNWTLFSITNMTFQKNLRMTQTDYLTIDKTRTDVNQTSMGKNLLDFCKADNLRILNGRVGRDKNLGNFTTRNNTVIDYCIANPELFPEVSHFEVLDFNPILSDVHCAITLNLKSKHEYEHEDEPDTIPTQGKFKWEQSKANEFKQNFCRNKLINIETKLNNLRQQNPQFVNQNDIQDIIKEINETFQEARNKTFKRKIFHKPNNKPWYDSFCKKAKNNFHKARRRRNQDEIKKHGKYYKNLINQKKVNYLKKIGK